MTETPLMNRGGVFIAGGSSGLVLMNVPYIIGLICTVLFLTIPPLEGHALTPSQVFDKVKESVVVVKTLNAHGKAKGQGSGVLLPSGKAATNCHVVEAGASYIVSRGKQSVRAVLYAEDRAKDICILDAAGIKGKPVKLGKAASLKVGAPVYAVGAPRGLELTLSNGIVAQLRGGPPPLIQTTAAISPGSSGGGLFDGEGHLVGLTTLYIEGGQSLNFAMPVEWIGEVEPGRKIVTKGHSENEWLKRAIALEKFKDWTGLLDWCLSWAQSEPESADAWFGIGVAYYNLKRYDDAIMAYRLSLSINPENAIAWYNLGVNYAILKRYDDEIEAYRQSLRINPENADAWYSLGVVYQKLKDLKRNDDAIEAYRQALRINPEHTQAWNNLGIAYSVIERYDDAIGAHRQALRINPEYTYAWYSLGVTYYLSGNRTAALNAVQELRRLDPERADKLFNMIVPR